MLSIRLQRMGKTHYATYRLIVQDSHRHPSRGKVVAYVGAYNPHTKDVQLNKDMVNKYLSNGAQPSARVAKLLIQQGIKLPKWFKMPDNKRQRAVRNPEKLRSHQPAEEPAEEPTEEPAKESVAESTEATEESAKESVAEPAEEQPAKD